MILKTSFHSYYSTFSIKPLKKKYLESALAVSSLKTRFTQSKGSYLPYMLTQGTTLTPFITIANEFKKGIETKIAAEFNTPLQLESYINVGTTINTEFLEGEIDAGFTEAQVKRSLITNGTFQSREIVSMLMVAELIKQGQQSIVFDYSGNWSKLIKLFEGTPYKNSIFYYKLGRTITIDPIHSEIPHDAHNLEFINLMLDVYAMSFKKDERTVAVFKNSLSKLSSNVKDDDFSADYSLLVTHVKNLPDHEKRNGVESIIATLEEFSAEDTTYLFSKYAESKLVSSVLEFLKTDKTIIIDVSGSSDLNKQVFFTWLMVAKFIHYLNFNDKYIAKFLVIPHLDIMFDVYFLEKLMKYGKISKFMTPLLQKGFGFICSTDQVHHLHPNVLTILDNYIAFKAIDSRDISTLKNLLNLEEMHGTGMYSKSRTEMYQTRYLMTMRPLEAIIKRTDINQPFPVKINATQLTELVSPDWKDIITHMDAQGFNMKNSERVILERAQKTVFEKDMGDHSHLIPEIITFLESLRTVHAVGNLYRSKIREELKNVVNPKLLVINQDRKIVKKMRDEIFDILFSRGYFVESHPAQASGGQSVRSSYQVSPKFDRVLEDYYETRRKTHANIDFEIMDQQSEIIPDFEFLPTQGSMLKKLPVKRVKAIIRSELIDILQWNLFQIARALNKGNLEHALTIAQDLSEMYVSNIQARIEGGRVGGAHGGRRLHSLPQAPGGGLPNPTHPLPPRAPRRRPAVRAARQRDRLLHGHAPRAQGCGGGARQDLRPPPPRPARTKVCAALPPQRGQGVPRPEVGAPPRLLQRAQGGHARPPLGLHAPEAPAALHQGQAAQGAGRGRHLPGRQNSKNGTAEIPGKSFEASPPILFFGGRLQQPDSSGGVRRLRRI